MATQISQLPIPPSRDDPANFSARADAFLGALPDFRTQANLLAVEAEQDAATATTKASESASSAASALASKNAAEAALDSFDDRYLGAKNTNPTVDNDGQPLLTGALYYNTVVPELRVYNGTSWVTASTVGGTVTNLTVINSFIAPDNSIALGTKTTGDYVAAGAVSGIGLSGSANAEGATFTVTSNATSANTANTLVSRDASGNFSAGTITASLNGNATSANTANSANSATSATTATNLSGGSVSATSITANSINISGSSTLSGRFVSDAVTPNSIITRDGSSHSFFNYINSNTGNGENPVVSQVLVTNGSDGFFRKAGISHLTASLQGTAPINITGNAGSVTNGVYNNGGTYSINITGNAASANTANTANSSNTATYAGQLIGQSPFYPGSVSNLTQTQLTVNRGSADSTFGSMYHTYTFDYYVIYGSNIHRHTYYLPSMTTNLNTNISYYLFSYELLSDSNAYMNSFAVKVYRLQPSQV